MYEHYIEQIKKIECYIKSPLSCSILEKNCALEISIWVIVVTRVKVVVQRRHQQVRQDQNVYFFSVKHG